MKKTLLVVDIPNDSTAEQAEVALNQPLTEGYYLRLMFPFPGVVRAFFQLYAPKPGPEKRDREDEAIKFVKDNIGLSIRGIYEGLKGIGITRSKTWVADRKADIAVNGSKSSQ
jgi:hypothetical protein